MTVTRLDARQRAMLEEMHIRVWWPAPEVGRANFAMTPPAVAAVPAAAPRPAARAVPEPRTALQPPAVAPAAPLPVAQGAAEVAAMDWPALADTVSECRDCRLCDGRQRPVFQPEPAARQVDWLVVGEPPDAEEEQSGSPFTGRAGELLDNMLRAVQVSRTGVSRAGARLTPVVKCRPGTVRNPRPEELATCGRYLQREIVLARPKVVLVMGRFAVQALLGPEHPELAGVPFGKLRGRPHACRGVPVVVTYHPALLLRSPEYKAGAWADLCLARALVQSSA